MVPVRRTTQSWLPDIFNDFFDNSWMEKANCTAPAINVIENEKDYEVEIAAPGLNKEDFKVYLDTEGCLVVNMEKKEEKKPGRFLRREFSYTNFKQAYSLPEDVEADKIEARMEHGVLHILLPKIVKVEKPQTHRQIEIQ